MIDTSRIAVGLVAVLVAVSGVALAGAYGVPAGPASQDRGATAQASAPAGGNETVETVTGTLRAGPGGEYRVGDLTVGIGPPRYVDDTEAPRDFDGDGSVETVRAEFDGLVGTEVTLTVEIDSDGGAGAVLAVNGTTYRERGRPPWAGGPNAGDGGERGGERGPPDHAGPKDDRERGPPDHANTPDDAGPPGHADPDSGDGSDD